MWSIIIRDNNLKKGTSDMEVKVAIWPTSPQVPIPAPIGIFVILNTTVAKGPKMAEAKIDGIAIFDF